MAENAARKPRLLELAEADLARARHCLRLAKEQAGRYFGGEELRGGIASFERWESEALEAVEQARKAVGA